MINFTSRSKPKKRINNRRRISDELTERATPSKNLKLTLVSIALKIGKARVKYPIIGGKLQLDDLRMV